MNPNQLLAFAAPLIMLILTGSVLERYVRRRKAHFLFWGIGLAMFAVASFAEAYFWLGGWSVPAFFSWYLFGAVLNAAWIGHGTLLLLIRKRWVRVATGILVGASLVATGLMVQAILRTDGGAYLPSVPISEQYRDLMPSIGDGGLVRLTTPFFNVYGMVMLVGGALWSAWLFARKQVLPNRVIGNVLIAAGALSIGLAGTILRLGMGSYLYLGELAAAGFMYAGFLVASRPATQAEREQAGATSSA